MGELTDKAKLELRDEVTSHLERIFKFWGPINVTALLAALLSVWSFAKSQVGSIAENVHGEIMEDINNRSAILNEAIAIANQIIGKLEARDEEIYALQTRISSLGSTLAALENTENMQAVTNFFNNWNGAEDPVAVLAAVNSMIGGQIEGCETARLFAGVAEDNSLNWQPYDSTPADTDMWANIDTSAAHFTQTPIYFVNLQGDSGHAAARGTNAIYSPQTDNFVYSLNWGTDESINIMEYAKSASRNWRVSWMAIGC
ncbi:MAG: hypothetical protein JKX69_06025 [Rhodobacteraceae bacterium]|nr:hypothetical protein [Paracoccaceae bacterium]